MNKYKRRKHWEMEGRLVEKNATPLVIDGKNFYSLDQTYCIYERMVELRIRRAKFQNSDDDVQDYDDILYFHENYRGDTQNGS